MGSLFGDLDLGVDFCRDQRNLLLVGTRSRAACGGGLLGLGSGGSVLFMLYLVG